MTPNSSIVFTGPVVLIAWTDMAGIVHFSNFYKWMEQCEHEFFRSLGLSIVGIGLMVRPLAGLAFRLSAVLNHRLTTKMCWICC